MAYDMIKTVLEAENAAKKEEEKARDLAKQIIDEAENTASALRQATIEQAKYDANLLIAKADEDAEGISNQAEKLAELREKKVITDNEKKYDDAIKKIIESIA